SLIRVTSRGGNFLLNIGPEGDGSVVPYEQEVLLKIGAWLKANGEAIYSTNPDPFHVRFDWGSITSKPGMLYLHLMKSPEANSIFLPGLKGKLAKAYVLATGQLCKTQTSKDGITVSLPTGINI